MAVAVDLLRDVDEILPGVIADRRHLHEHPELGFQEHETAKFVADRLRSLGVEDLRTGINGTGVTGVIRGALGEGPCVLVRADMDALPIHEQNDVEYRSKNDGVMHACGHDAHTSMLLGVARILIERKDRFAGSVKLLFQPAEELPPGGAKGMIKEGVLEDPHVAIVLGMHVYPNTPTGTIRVGGGPTMAAADRFSISIQGNGGHGASPHRCVDPVLVGSHIVSALQTLGSREVDPIDDAVVTVAVFNAGEAFNVIPDRAELGGTVRTFLPETRDLLERRIGQLATDLAGAMGARATVRYERGYPALINDHDIAEHVRESAGAVIGAGNVQPAEKRMPAEDFSYFLQERPGCFFYIGTGNPELDSEHPHHHPRFAIDEDGMATGMVTMASAVLRYLQRV